jgi:prostaglandin-E synthase
LLTCCCAASCGETNKLYAGPEEHKYVLDLELYGEIDASDIKQAITDRTITLVIAKKEEGPYWPRLLKAGGKTPQYIKADWDKWVDEDEEDEAEDPFKGVDFSSMGGSFNPMDIASMAGDGGFDMSKLGDLAAGVGQEGDSEDDSEDEEDVPA